MHIGGDLAGEGYVAVDIGVDDRLLVTHETLQAIGGLIATTRTCQKIQYLPNVELFKAKRSSLSLFLND